MNSYFTKPEVWVSNDRSGKNIASDYLERPAMRSLLGKLKGKSVLCVGCGGGDECDYILRRGAKSALGVDSSPGLISIARKSFPNITFEVMDMEKMAIADSSFDMVYSSLAIHYKKNWGKTLQEFNRVLRPGGTVLLSAYHPIVTGSLPQILKDGKSKILGHVGHSDKPVEIFGDYLTPHKITDTWFGNFTVTYYHQPLVAIVDSIQRAGFKIKTMQEPKAIPSARAVNENFYLTYQKLPLFIVFELTKG